MNKKQKIDFSKPVQTRDGRKVEILRTGLNGSYPVIGVVTDDAGNETLGTWRFNGDALIGVSGNLPGDLVQAKTFDPRKPFRVKNGTKMRLLADDFEGDYPIVAARISENGKCHPTGIRWFTEDGYFPDLDECLENYDPADE
jgi:hypothetical protein